MKTNEGSIKTKVILYAMLVFIISKSFGQSKYIPTQDNLVAREWFKNAKFGMFIHWGVYSILGNGEWVMSTQKIGINEYNKLPAFFNPIDYDAEEWVKIAKSSGMKYITVTTRHHDGFSMFDSKVTDYDIVDSTPYGKDVIKELVDACHKHDMKIFLYYSLVDWHRDDYFPRGKSGSEIKGRKIGRWEEYIAFIQSQLTELLTNYGKIDGIWFDGIWDKKDANWHYDEIYSLIHNLQPHCLVGNNHHLSPKLGEDFQMFEKNLPGKNKDGFGTNKEHIGGLPKEVCETINKSWGFKLKDTSHKSKKELIKYLAAAAGYDANLLLNIGPMPNGKIQEAHIDVLKQVGEWLKKNGETIYNTTKGPVPPTENMFSTKKEKTVFLHIFNNKKASIIIPEITFGIRSVKLFSNKQKLKYKLTSYGLVIPMLTSFDTIDTIDTIIEIELK